MPYRYKITKIGFEHNRYHKNVSDENMATENEQQLMIYALKNYNLFVH